MKNFDTPTRRVGASLVATLVCLTSAQASTCPFDTGGSDAVNDGVVLTRYALGITGTPLVASTRYASLDPLQVKANIECVGCALDINGDGQVDTVDTTIIARHLAGFQGASLTNGLALGAGTRNTTTLVASFLTNGCAVGGAINAFVQGGNAFGAPAVLGTTDGQPVSVSSDNLASLMVTLQGGLRVSYSGLAEVNTVGGSVMNSATASVGGATIAGGGMGLGVCADPVLGGTSSSCSNTAHGSFSVIGGGRGNVAGTAGQALSITDAVVAGGQSNVASGSSSVVSGGLRNRALSGASSVVGGMRNTAGAPTANGAAALGGIDNQALGSTSTTVGGLGNKATGDHSLAAGSYSDAAHYGTFVWTDSSEPFIPYASTAPNQFAIRAVGGVRLSNGTSQFFGTQTRQMLNLWGTEFGIGVQTNTLYQRSYSTFSWFIGGTHCDTQNCPGAGGTENMRLTANSLLVNGVVLQSSDRALKENITRIDPKTVLAKLVALPVSAWNYRRDAVKTRHLGPMAQDFKRLFNIGQDDKTIATIDAQGVALAAIQGLHAMVKEKDAEIEALRRKTADLDQLRQKAARVDAMEAELRAIKRKLGM
ncbi:MAG: tail fiber domain-containing protein [Burkholderiales bacterium]|nr:tail fiber domain-containing protein [Burkholderiales bacterium]